MAMKAGAKLLLFFFLSFFLFLTFSCSKDGGNIKAEGTVIDKTTGNPVPEAMVYLRQIGRNLSLAGGMGGATIASQKADANCRFSFVFDANYKDNIYVVQAVKENYYDDSNNEASVPSGGASDLKVPMVPYAYLKIHVVNANSVDQFDYISVNNSFSSGGGGPFVGRTVDAIAIGKVMGNHLNTLVWFVRKNGVETKYKDSIICSAFDTTLYEIKY
jgi:hypothetical protein